MPKTTDHTGSLDDALALIKKEVISGLEHGHFKMEIECEMINEQKRRLIVDAGKKHRFVIATDEISR